MPLQIKFDCKWEIDKPAGKPHSSDHYKIIWYKNTPVFTEISQELFYLLEYLMYYMFTLNL